ncbi:hypothetical protein [Aquimarina brevivitae]|uniref:Natural product n=1 Tax=Aquimarina brevivitae TaxID=323412 RepID=A0A4Q7PFR5_9FLAO|nr:hypothetical protein [Aquimarina brevivitae]RZS99027.1 hypothetical protein EV197_0231 [Aquimarina brevivitae]
MKTNLLNIKGVTVLSKKSQSTVKGEGCGVDLSLCGCSCSGSVTGPFYCYYFTACPQIYTCDEAI